MKIELKNGWRVERATDDFSSFSESAKEISLPYDALISTERNFFSSLGYQNSYFSSEAFCFFTTIPEIEKKDKVLLEICGLNGFASIYIDGEFITALNPTKSFVLVDITEHYAPQKTLCLRIASHPDSGGYLGLGIGGSVSLISRNSVFVAPYSTKIKTDKALISVLFEVENSTNIQASLPIQVELLRPNLKRAASKQKSIKVAPKSKKAFELVFKFNKGFEYTSGDPYLYAAKLSLQGQVEAVEKFGLKTVSNQFNRLTVNSRPFELRACRISSENGFLGAVSEESFEKRRLKQLKQAGYNTVCVFGCPNKTLLDTLDKLGMFLIVNLPSDFKTQHSILGSIYFNSEWEKIIDTTVKAVRNRACLIGYEATDNRIIERIKLLDDTKPVFANLDLENGTDYLGENEPSKTKNQLYTTDGILDITASKKPKASLREIALGKKGVLEIFVQDPDSVSVDDLEDNLTDIYPLFDWPRHLSKPIKVVVFSSGDIVSLKQDGKSIGRKLAGKTNNYTAVFKTNFYPSKLEAISYFRGSEEARAELNSSNEAKKIKLEQQEKSIRQGEKVIVDISILDKNSSFIPFASKEVYLEVQGGELAAVGSADLEVAPQIDKASVYTFDGRAVALVKATTDQPIIIKATSDGLTSATLRVKVV